MSYEGSLKTRLTSLRRALWHLRNGGVDALKEHQRRERSTRTLRMYRSRKPRKGELSFPEWPTARGAHAQPTHQVTAAIIADEFTRSALAHEWNTVELSAANWREELTTNTVDIVFIESAWHGNDDQWRYQVIGPGAPGSRLRELIAKAQELGIPVVLWNKEDPAHFAESIETAKLADYVFTTDSTLLEEYRRLLGHDRVDVLPFATQPRIHNPIRPVDEAGRPLPRRDVAFAGMYFAEKYPERREQMEVLLGGAADVSSRLTSGLDIFSRYLGADEKYQFPSEYSSYVRGSLPYAQMLTANRLYSAFINVNSVVDSPSMCARRIFEITACNTPVVTMPTPATEAFFPEGTLGVVESREHAGALFRALCANPDLRDRMCYLAQREIWLKHTYTQRVDTVLRAIGREDAVAVPPTVAPLISSIRPAQLRHVVQTLARQQAVRMQPIVLTHGFTADEQIRGFARECGLEVSWMTAPTSQRLGENYASMLERVDADYIAKMDDDDLYGDHYLFESLIAAHYAQAEIVGKHAHFMYLAHEDVTALRFPQWEHRYSSFVSGPTIVARADLARQVGFQPVTTGEDSAFLTTAAQEGARIYSASRFGFVQQRDPQRQHTWGISSAQVLATATISHWGPPNATELP